MWLCKYLDRQRYKVTICSLSTPDPALVRHLETELQTPVVDVGTDHVADVRTLFRTTALLNRLQPTIVHTHALRPDWYGRLSARLEKIPIVCTTVRNEDDLCYANEYGYSYPVVMALDLVNRLTARYADALIAVSEGVERYLVERQRVDPSKVRHIPNGVDLAQFEAPIGSSDYLRTLLDLPKDTLIVGTVAALKQQKGLQYLLEAANQIRHDYPRIHFVFVGSGPLEGEIRAWIQQNGLKDAVTLLGQRDDIPALLEGMDIFAFPSLWEGMPRALLEAMATGRPCIATDIGGSRELVVDQQTGLLVPPSDVGALRGALQEMLSHPERRARYGQAARARVEAKFSAQAVADAHDQLYQELLNIKT